MAKSHLTTKQLFDLKWEAVPECGCWIWTACAGAGGYGRVADGKGGNMPAHRRAWELYRAPIPDGMCVCHHCDTPPCVNPDHLFLGTVKNNMEDRDRKGRMADKAGAANGRAKLTVENVAFIRSQMALGIRGMGLRLSRQFGVSNSNIYRIAKGENWHQK